MLYRSIIVCLPDSLWDLHLSSELKSTECLSFNLKSDFLLIKAEQSNDANNENQTWYSYLILMCWWRKWTESVCTLISMRQCPCESALSSFHHLSLLPQTQTADLENTEEVLEEKVWCYFSSLSLCDTHTLVEWEGKQQESQVWDSLCMLFHYNQLYRVEETAEEVLQNQILQHVFKEWQGMSEK